MELRVGPGTMGRFVERRPEQAHPARGGRGYQNCTFEESNQAEHMNIILW